MLLVSFEKEAISDAGVADVKPLISDTTSSSVFQYTWSKPDCSFTVNFPTKPTVVERELELGVIFKRAEFNTPEVGYEFVCFQAPPRFLKETDNLSTAEQTSLFLNQIRNFTDTENLSIEFTRFKNHKNAVAFANKKTTIEDTVYIHNTVSYGYHDTFAYASYTSKFGTHPFGEEFIGTVKLKPELRSDPVPLSYTWSSPHCPFSVDFPGRPEVRQNLSDKELPIVLANFKTQDGVYSADCFANSYSERERRNFNTEYEFVKNMNAEAAEIAKPLNMKDFRIKDTRFANQENAVLYTEITMSTEEIPYAKQVVITYVNGDDFITVMYNSADGNIKLGDDFLKSVKLKLNP